MEKSVFRFILRYSYREQIVLTLMAFASFPFLYLSYDVPKNIVNNAIQGAPESFPKHLWFGIEVGQITYLYVLCGIFLALVLINQGFKYMINVYKGRTGERMLRRLRYDLYGRVLRFPLPHFRKTGQGEIIPMITQEVEPIGGFVGDAFALPAFQGGTLLTILGFLLWQDWRMALAAVALYPVQFYIIPKLQRRVRALNKERIRRVRRLSERVSESIQGVQEVHTHGTARWMLATFADHLHGIFDLRFKVYNLKFLIKLLNNFIQQLGPFFFFSIGGYLVIQGELEVGTLVAAIAAHKDLASPWKELLTYYEMQADVSVKYEQIVSQFEPAGMREQRDQVEEPAEVPRFDGELTVANLTLLDDNDQAVLDGISFRVPLDARVAFVGPPGGGRDELMLLLARLIDPSRGSIAYGRHDLQELSETALGRCVAYVGPISYVFNGSIGDNVLYGLRHRPVRERAYEGPQATERQRYRMEADRSGNMDLDPLAEWIDPEEAGAADDAELKAAILRVFRLMALDEDVYQFGLRGTIDAGRRADLADAILRARSRLVERLADPEIAALVEPFDRERYNENASVAENLVFGSVVGDAFDPEQLAEHPYVREVLDRVGLSDTFLSMGYQVASTMIDLFADLPPDHELFQQFSFISSDDLPEFQALVQRADRNNLGQLAAGDRLRLMSLPFRLIPARHRLGVIDDEFRGRILQARQDFAENLPAALQGAIEFFDRGRYNSAANLQDNILFGKIAHGQARAQERVGALISDVIEELGLRSTVVEVGLGFQVGVGGARLSGQQRQKLALARALLRRPQALVLSESTASLDSASQEKIMDGMLEEFRGRSLLWSLHRVDAAERFDHVVVMRRGRVLEHGTFAELDAEGTALTELRRGS